MHKLIAFLIIGIGYDDVYVLMNGFDRALQETDEPDELISKTFASNGVSVTVSSITSFISFSVGNFSSLYMISSFSCFAGLGVLLLWVNQFLIFGPFLTLHAQYVVEKKSDPLTPCFPDMPLEHENIELPHDPETNNVQFQNVQNIDSINLNLGENHIINNNQDTQFNHIEIEKNSTPEPKNILNKIFNFY